MSKNSIRAIIDIMTSKSARVNKGVKAYKDVRASKRASKIPKAINGVRAIKVQV